MKYFMIEGILKNPDKIDENIMNEHMAYTKEFMDNGLTLMSGLKEDMSGGLFVMKAESIKMINDYLSNEPFKKYDIQDYKVIAFNPHYFNQSPCEWFSK